MRRRVLIRRSAMHRGVCAWLVGLLITATPGGFGLTVRAAALLTAQAPTEIPQTGTVIGRTNAAQPISLAVSLKPHMPAALDTFLTQLYDPASPSYQHYLTPPQFTQQFFDAADRAQVDDYLRAQGFAVNDPGVGSVIDATTNVAQVERAFNLTIANYRDANGRLSFANDVTPALPQAIAARINGLFGLDNAEAGQRAGFPAPPQPTPARVTPNAGTGCAAATTFATNHNTYLPNQFATAYNIDALHALGFHGEGQTVALFEASDYYDTDPQAFETCFGISPFVPLTRVFVDTAVAGSYTGEGEVDGDIEAVVGQATKLAGIRVYETPNSNQGFIDTYAKIANDDAASVVSTSWYNCEQRLLAGRAASENTAFQQMAAQGQSIFAAAGDYGSTSCKQFGGAFADALSLDDPASQPYVTGVGGTNLTINSATNAYTSEHIWNNYPSTFGAGGGGLSITWARPSYQTGPGVLNAYSNGNRQVPDVTATGDCQWTFYITGAWKDYCGTSFATPLWAAGTVMMNQSLVAHTEARLGFANPALYRVFTTSAYPAAFHDVTMGDNCFDPSSTCGTPNSPSGEYPATANYDLASGIGSPNFGNLANALLVPHALPGPQPAPSPSGSPAALPTARPPGPPNGTTPNPLPSPRP